MNRWSILALGITALAGGCGPDEYRAEIRWTSHGIPHITASDYASLGFGEGYAQAAHHACSVVDQVVRVRGERARYFGEGDRQMHLLSDIGFKGLQTLARAERDLEEMSPEYRTWIEGYATGVNHYLEETGAEDLGGWCKGADWVQPITAIDVAAYLRSLMNTSTFLLAPIAAAAPPGSAPRSAALEALPDPGMASNGWAVGGDLSASGRGMLLANPHYPWVGSNRFWEKHLTIPGELDVYGVGLIGLPGMVIGLNEGVAWTHTVSAGRRFTAYRLELVPGDPLKYRWGDEIRDIQVRPVSVEVRGQDGSLSVVTDSVYFSHHGPLVGLGGLEWTEEQAFAFRFVNEDNQESVDQWLSMAQATTMDAFQAAHREHGGMPWINTIAASADGRAWYIDSSRTPHLSTEAFETWQEAAAEDPLVGALDRQGITLLDGSDPRFDWVDDPTAVDPGMVPYDALPQLERRDYVFNANDSYWVANSDVPLTGYPRLHGGERTPLSPRTRMNDRVLHPGPLGESGADGAFTFDELTKAAFSNRGFTAELLAPELADRCRDRPWGWVEGRRIDLNAACDVLGRYDGRLDLDSRGAILWREFITRYDVADFLEAGALFAVAFDPDEPIETPRGLAAARGGQDPALDNLAAAVDVLTRAGIPLDAPLGEWQYAIRGRERIPVHGGQGFHEGVTNYANYAANGTTTEPDAPLPPRVEGSQFLREGGYPINRGTSFIMVAGFTPEGPRARALLTYSQSGNPDSRLHGDQTHLFSRKQWREVLFTDEAIAADPELETVTVRRARP